MTIDTGRRLAAHRYTRLFLSCGIALGAMAASQAFAQDSTNETVAVEVNEAAPVETVPSVTPVVDESAGEEVIVTGRRPIAESEAAALIVQRRSDSLVAVAASDSVGRLPDQNIAQATSRLPGVAVERDQGQARYISLRGAPKQWTTLSINGIPLVSPEGRDTRFDSIPSAIASQIIIHKAVTPDMTGETVAGLVEIKTRSAFDYKGFHIAGKVGAGLVELGGGKEYEGQVVVSNRWDTGMGEIGLVGSASYYERNMVTDNFELDWEGVSQDRQPGGEDRIWVREAENKMYRLKRQNYSYSGRLDWEPTPGHVMFAESIFTTFLDTEARDNYQFDMDDRQSDRFRGDDDGEPVCTPAFDPTPTTTGYADTCIGNTPLKGILYGVDIVQRSNLRELEQSIFSNTLGGDHEFGDTWDLSWRLNYAKAKDDRGTTGESRYTQSSTRSKRPTVAYDFTDPQKAEFQIFRTIGPVDGEYSAGEQVYSMEDFERTLNQFHSNDFVDITKAYTGKFGLSHELPMFGGEGKITFGAQYDQRTKEANERQLFLDKAGTLAAGMSPTFLPDSSDLPFQGDIDLSYNFRYVDVGALRDMVEKAKAVGTYDPITANFYNVREQVYAAYLMGRVAYDWGSVLAGARVEHIKNRGKAFLVHIPEDDDVPAEAPTPVESNEDITMIYPSLHANFNVARDKKLRLSFNTGASRPDYDQMRPNIVVDDANELVNAGNPDLKPERAYGVDAYFEWYVEPQGYLMFGVFYKKLKDVLFEYSTEFGLDTLNFGGVDRSEYQLDTVVNGGNGYLYGAEAAVQMQLEPYTADMGLPDWMGGFGVSANLTYNKSRVSDPDGNKVTLPGTSEWVYNASLYYEKHGGSVRLSYQGRSSWLDVLGDPVADGGNKFWAAEDELDFSARYAVTPNLEFYFDASNLLDGPGRRYTRESIYTVEWEKQGRRFTGGIRFNF